MGLDRVRAQEQLLGDLPVGQARATSRATFRSCGVSSPMADGSRRRAVSPVAASSERARSAQVVAPALSNPAMAERSAPAPRRARSRRLASPSRSSERAARRGSRPPRALRPTTRVARSNHRRGLTSAPPARAGVAGRSHAATASKGATRALLPETGPRAPTPRRAQARWVACDGVARQLRTGSAARRSSSAAAALAWPRPSSRTPSAARSHGSPEPASEVGGSRNVVTVRLTPECRLDPRDHTARVQLFARLPECGQQVELLGRRIEGGLSALAALRRGR
jgi:hypothetical protein